MVADNLETEVASQLNAVGGPGVQTGLGIEHHVIVGVGNIPLAAEDCLGSYNGIRRDLNYRRLLAALLGQRNRVSTQVNHDIVGAG